MIVSSKDSSENSRHSYQAPVEEHCGEARRILLETTASRRDIGARVRIRNAYSPASGFIYDDVVLWLHASYRCS